MAALDTAWLRGGAGREFYLAPRRRRTVSAGLMSRPNSRSEQTSHVLVDGARFTEQSASTQLPSHQGRGSMEHLQPARPEDNSRRLSGSSRWLYPAVVIGLSAVLLLLVAREALLGVAISPTLMRVVPFSFFTAILIGTFFLVRAVREYRESQERFQEMATNIQEIFWMIDAESRRVLYVNEAYGVITGRSRQSLLEKPSSCEELIHPDDKAAVLEKIDRATKTGQFNERFRIVCVEGEVRWIHVRGFPVRDASGKIFRLVGTAQEITEHKRAEDQVIENLAIAEAARAEADALRKATMALTLDLHMDSVMDALLRSLEDLVPYTCARVLVPEGGPHVLALGERLIPEPPKTVPQYRPGHPLTLTTNESPFLERVMEERKSILIPDTKDEPEWSSFAGHARLRSWLSVPLIASGEYLGCLSVGHGDPRLYSSEHLRRAELLAIPAAAAIENARLFTRAEIYASELEKRLVDLREAETALAEAKGEKTVSEAEFQKVFRSSPIAFSITTLKEGRFIDVNAAFERRYGYSREEVLGRTVYELGMWCDLSNRMFMVEELELGRPVRNVITWLRAKSGEIKLTAYSADRIHFAGESCILAVSEDVPELDKKKAN